MADAEASLVIWTYDWVPPMPRGFVRDLRLAWACQEAELDYSVQTVPFDNRGPAHLERQPFAQVPFLDHGDLRIFESGAALLHIAKLSEALMPRSAKGEAEVTQWIIAALNSVEMVTVPYWFLKITGGAHEGLSGWLESRLSRLEAVLAQCEWLADGRFTAADLLMADVLRMDVIREFGDYPAINAYVERVLSRPAFHKARAEQIAHFEAADKQREKEK